MHLSGRAGVVLLGVALLGCGANKAKRPGGSSDNVPVEELLETASRVRGLAYKHPVPWKILQDGAKPQGPAGAAATPSQADRLEASFGAVQDAMGLLAPDYSAQGEEDAMVRDQLFGWYDPHGKKLFVVDKNLERLVPGASPSMQQVMFRATIIHEGAHALQDQHFNIGPLLETADSLDILFAHRSMLEGDATLTAMDALRESAGAPFMAGEGAVQDANAQGMDVALPTLKNLSAGLSELLVRSYNDGAAWAAAVRRVGGERLRNATFQHPPASMSQVLHPERYVAGASPDRVPAAPVQHLESTGYRAAHQGRLGELMCLAYLGPFAGNACAGWQGDDALILEDVKTQDHALAWLTTWKDEDAAKAFDAAVEERAQAACTSMVRCDLGVTVFSLQVDRRVLVLRNVAPALEQELVEPWLALPVERVAAAPPKDARWVAETPQEPWLDLVARVAQARPVVEHQRLRVPELGVELRGLTGTWEVLPAKEPFHMVLRGAAGEILGVALTPVGPWTAAAPMGRQFAVGFAKGIGGSVTSQKIIAPAEGKVAVLSTLKGKAGLPSMVVNVLRHGWAVNVVGVPAKTGGMDAKAMEAALETIHAIPVLDGAP